MPCSLLTVNIRHCRW